MIGHHTNRYFVGMKVEVEILLPSTKSFRDWAIISEIDEDLVALQLSRDILPEGVSLRVGQALTITSQKDGNTYECRAFIVSKGYEQDLLLRFTSETISNESREFYRVDAYIPIKFHMLYDQNPVNVKLQWEARNKQRRENEAIRERRRLELIRIKHRNEEHVRTQILQEGNLLGEPVVLPQEKPQDNQYYETWGAVTTLAVNISGGGLKIFTNQKFNMDEMILLETYVPTSRCILDIVARVVYTNYSNNTEDDKNNSTSMQFVFIDESARSAINNYISSIQLKRIRQFKGFTDVEPVNENLDSLNRHFAYIDSINVPEKTGPQDLIHNPNIRQVLLGLFFVCVVSLLFFYFYGYGVMHSKNEIQEIFENSLKK